HGLARPARRPHRHYRPDPSHTDWMTMSELAPSAQKVHNAAATLGLDITVREMPDSTRTAEKAAAAVGVTVGQIVKSLVFMGATSGKPYLLLVSGSNRVYEAGVAEHLGVELNLTAAD